VAGAAGTGTAKQLFHRCRKGRREKERKKKNEVSKRIQWSQKDLAG
jgi:hypothetical protein